MSKSQLSLKKNYFYNILVQIVNIGFPLVTIPYITRVLGPEELGKVNFALSFVQYFIIFANLGIGAYAVREISKVRDNKEELSRVLSELFSLLFFSTLVVSLIYSTTFLFVDKVKSDPFLYFVVGLSLFLNQMAVSWFFVGIENFKYFSIRNILFKLVSLVLIFLMVKNQRDYIVYGFILSFSLFGANILDFTLARRYANVKIVTSVFKHIKPTTIFFISSVFSILYSGIDVIILGFLDKVNVDKSVGIFSVAKRIVMLAIFILNSVINVNYTRLSYILSKAEIDDYRNLLKKTSNFIMLVSFFSFALVFSFSKEILFLMGGEKFIEADLTLKLLSLLIVTNIMRNILESQVLNPNNLEKFVAIGNVISWIVSSILLIVLVPLLSYNGASVSVVVGDLLNGLFFLVVSLMILKILPLTKQMVFYLAFSLVIILFDSVIRYFKVWEPLSVLDILLYMFIFSVIYGGIYLVGLILSKDENLKVLFNFAVQKLKSFRSGD